MRFTVPRATTPEQAIQIYESARGFVEGQTGWATTQRRIAAIRYRHNGNEYLAQVGDSDYSDGLVVSIFEAPNAFLVCTPTRGVIRGEPIIVGISDVSYIDDFDAD